LLRIRAKRQVAARFVTVRLLLDGKPVETIGARRLAEGVNVNLRSRGRFTVTIVAITRAGRMVQATYHYRACANSTARHAGQLPTMLPAIPGG
jgi:hypothetical protein